MDLTLATAVPLIVAITQGVKSFNIPNRYLPFVDIVLGIGAGFALHLAPLTAVITGIGLGLSAAGLYRAAKVTVFGQ